MSPPNAKGRPRQGGHSAITHPDRTATDSTTAVIAAAIRYLASGEATYDQLVVERCPFCSFPHRHVAFETTASRFERSPSCRRSATYVVVVAKVVPAARPTRTRTAAA